MRRVSIGVRCLSCLDNACSDLAQRDKVYLSARWRVAHAFGRPLTGTTSPQELLRRTKLGAVRRHVNRSDLPYPALAGRMTLDALAVFGVDAAGAHPLPGRCARSSCRGCLGPR
jgi:hypothetical protein